MINLTKLEASYLVECLEIFRDVIYEYAPDPEYLEERFLNSKDILESCIANEDGVITIERYTYPENDPDSPVPEEDAWETESPEMGPK